MVNKIIKMIEIIRGYEVEEGWIEATKIIESEYELFLSMLNKNQVNIYGVTTMVGHMDNISLNLENISEFQKYLIYNHNLRLGSDNYSYWEYRCILYTKICMYKNGGSGCSPDIYEGLLSIHEDKNFKIQIPRNSTYSCGDVIPASFFAREVIKYVEDKNGVIGYKDGISLINGNFISVGLAISLLPSLLYIMDNLITNSVLYYRVSGADTSSINEFLYEEGFMKSLSNYLSLQVKNTKKMTQEPVSVRSTTQMIEAIYDSVVSLSKFISKLLSRPSDNPLISENDEVLNNASFYSPTLSIKLGSITEALLFAGWIIERRVHNLLSGKYANIPANISTKDNPLGLIQVPKLITSKLEEVRFKHSRRIFASGSSTSYGIEDAWALSSILSQDLKMLIDNIYTIICIEKNIFEYIETQNFEEFTKKLEEIGNHKITDDENLKYESITRISF